MSALEASAAAFTGDPPRLGFLGTGWIGRNRMQALHIAGGGAVAVVAVSSEAAYAPAALGPGVAVAPSYRDLLDRDLDGIVIATPSALHAEQAIAALDRGLAVFCQKPLGRSAEEVRAVVAAAAQADRLLGVDLSYRHTAGLRRIRQAIAEGALGTVFATDLTFHNAYGPDKPWFYDKQLAGGGALMDLGIHLADLGLWMASFPEVRSVQCRIYAGGAPVSDAAVEDYVIATVELATGCTLRLACSWRLNAGAEALIEASFYGTQGGARFRNVSGSFYDFEAALLHGTSTQPLTAPPDDWGGRAAVDWAGRLAAGSRFDAAVGHELIRSAELLDALYAAARWDAPKV